MLVHTLQIFHGQSLDDPLPNINFILLDKNHILLCFEALHIPNTDTYFDDITSETLVNFGSTLAANLSNYNPFLHLEVPSAALHH